MRKSGNRREGGELRLNEVLTMNRNELDYYVTQRLLEFYDGLIERGQIKPPIQKPIPEDQVSNHCMADQAPSPSLPRSEGVSSGLPADG